MGSSRRPRIDPSSLLGLRVGDFVVEHIIKKSNRSLSLTHALTQSNKAQHLVKGEGLGPTASPELSSSSR